MLADSSLAPKSKGNDGVTTLPRGSFRPRENLRFEIVGVCVESRTRRSVPWSLLAGFGVIGGAGELIMPAAVGAAVIEVPVGSGALQELGTRNWEPGTELVGPSRRF